MYKHVQICTMGPQFPESSTPKGLHHACNNKFETCFCSRHCPQARIILDFLEELRWCGLLALEDSCVSFIPHIPINKNDDGAETSSRRRRCAIYVFSPSLYRASQHLEGRSCSLPNYIAMPPYTPSVATVLKYILNLMIQLFFKIHRTYKSQNRLCKN